MEMGLNLGRADHWVLAIHKLVWPNRLLPGRARLVFEILAQLQGARAKEFAKSHAMGGPNAM